MANRVLRGVFIAALAFWAYAQSAAATNDQKLTDEGKALIKAVMALQKTATESCLALPSVKQYGTALEAARSYFKASGQEIDWRTGELVKGDKK